MTENIRDRIFSIENDSEFLNIALEVFDFQYNSNSVYQLFARQLKKVQGTVENLSDLPFLPAEFFRNHMIISGDHPVQKIFESSGTTGSSTSRHYVCDTGLYERSFLNSFRYFYGDPSEYMIAALLPSYTERENSSLVYMADYLIRASKYPSSGFYRENEGDLIRKIKNARMEDNKVLLLGVSFALLDLAEREQVDLSGIIIMETGGMKGRRKELTRPELHGILKNAFNVSSIHSEYGMTELLSQSYSKGNGLYYSPPWMKVIIRDIQDPLSFYKEPGRTGGINIIDLANIYSCSFISTGDLGRIHDDGGFEVLGRFDNSDIRGCNLLAE